MDEESQKRFKQDLNHLYGFLEQARRIMPMLIGALSVESLHTFLLGWRFGKYSGDGSLDEEEREFFPGFQEFVNKKYRKGGVYSWAGYIVERIGSDGEEAVAEFYRLFDQFREQKQKEKAREERRRKKEAKATDSEEQSRKGRSHSPECKE
jgi:hypothetical protein